MIYGTDNVSEKPLALQVTQNRATAADSLGPNDGPVRCLRRTLRSGEKACRVESIYETTIKCNSKYFDFDKDRRPRAPSWRFEIMLVGKGSALRAILWRFL